MRRFAAFCDEFCDPSPSIFSVWVVLSAGDAQGAACRVHELRRGGGHIRWTHPPKCMTHRQSHLMALLSASDAH
eukprot:6206485-Pleurochrysis_carterae.AAC.1